MSVRDNLVFSLLMCASVFSLLGTALASDWQVVWRFFTLPTLVPAFGDMRTITGINFSLAYGFDPMLDNPGDPWGRAVNYPRIWIYFAQLLKLRADDAILLGMLFAAIYAAVVCGIGTLVRSRLGKAVLFAVALSPALLLGLERANNDLVILALLVAFVAFFDRVPLLAWACLAVACVLKVFPVVLFAIVPFLRGRQLAIAAAAFVGVALYIFGIREQLALIAANTPISAGWSYGTESFAEFLNGQYKIDIDRAAMISYAAWIGLAVAGFASGALWRLRAWIPSGLCFARRRRRCGRRAHLCGHGPLGLELGLPAHVPASDNPVARKSRPTRRSRTFAHREGGTRSCFCRIDSRAARRVVRHRRLSCQCRREVLAGRDLAGARRRGGALR
jgi:hypothetical protein